MAQLTNRIIGSRQVDRWLLPLALLLLLAGAGYAYDSAVAMGKIPPHERPWVETTRLDLQTILLWKFGGEAEGAEELGEGKDEPVEREAADPELHGDAKLVETAGRFGGGLAVNGGGYVAGTAGLGTLLRMEGGFTLEGWVQIGTAKGRETLLTIPASDGKALVAVELLPEAAIAVQVEGTERLRLPLVTTTGHWHFVALTVDGGLERTSLTLLVDGQHARASAPAWLKGSARRLGERFTVGGGPGVPGLHGVVDEVRLSSGTRFFYPWKLGWQEWRDGRQDAALRSPYFRRGTVLTHLPFDGTLTPTPFAGLAVEGTSTPTLFKPGLKGQALDLSRIDKAGFKLNGFSILPEKDGTVEFWFRPLEWHNFYVGDFRGTDLTAQWLLMLTEKGAAPYTAPKHIEVLKGRNWEVANQRLPDGSSAMAWTPIHPGVWTHVLLVTQGGSTSTYLNGRRTKFWQVGLIGRATEPLKKWRERTGGKDDGTWAVSFTPSPTLVDEFSVYSWAMSAEEAWNAYARWLPDAAQQMTALPIFRVEFDYFAHSWDRVERLVTKLTCLPVEDVTPASADLEIRSATGEVLFSAEKQALDATGNATFTLKRPLPFGRYPTTVRSRSAAGVVLKEEKREYLREKPAWFGNALGKERTVPTPWTPVTVVPPGVAQPSRLVAASTQLQVIGRTLTLGANGLPAKIETLKQQVLAKPMTVRATSAAGTGMLEGKGVTVTESAPDRAAWTAALTGAGLTAELDASLEFDGLLYCAITLKPATGETITLDSLDIDVPMSPTVGTQLLANGGGNDFRTSWIARMLPEGTGSVWRSVDKPYPSFTRASGVTNFMPHIWLGNDDVGLYFGAENDRGWTVDGPKPAQEILRQDGAVHFQLHIIREPVTITKDGHRFHFVLLPTPAKPEPPDWRQQMATGGVNFGSCDSFGGFDMKTDPTDASPNDTFLLEPRSWAHAAAMAPQSRAKWGRCILYADASWPGMGPTFRDWNHDLWAGAGRLAWTPECEDYAVWAINEYLVRGLIDGVYWDDVSVGYTQSLASTAYPYAKSENGRRVGFTALAQRRVNLRLWRLFAAAGKEPCIWAHMTVCYEVPLFSFCRYLSNGEFLTGVDYPKSRDAMDFWSPETLRVLGSAAKWGTGVNYLTTLPRTLPVGPAVEQWLYPQRRAEDAAYLPADIGTLSDGLVAKLKTAGFYTTPPAKVFPAWKAADVLTLGAPAGTKLQAGVYLFEDRAFVCVANRDREVRDVRLELKLAELFPGAKGVLWRDLDPGLKPPKQVMASEKDVQELDPDAAAGDEGLKEAPLSEAEKLKALAVRPDGDAARVLIRARDYRILEARPVR
jgi:hypothetical protein